MIKILSAEAAVIELNKGKLKDFKLISIRCPGSIEESHRVIDLLSGKCLGVHVVRMHDIQDDEPIRDGDVLPSIDNVAPALKFAQGAKNVAVHCTAGVSRSSAMAFLIECQRTGDPDKAMEVLNLLLHFPNMTAIKVGQEILKMNLVQKIEKFNEKAIDAFGGLEF